MGIIYSNLKDAIKEWRHRLMSLNMTEWPVS